MDVYFFCVSFHSFAMTLLSFLLAHWACCSPLTRDVLRQCVNIASLKSPKRFKLECAGSGVSLGTTTNVTKIFDEYRVFLGHGGQEVDSVDQIPSTYNEVLVLSRHTFRGVCKKQAGFSDNIYKIVWNPQGTRFAYVTNGSIVVREPQTFHSTKYIQFETIMRTYIQNSHGVMWSPDGDVLALSQNFELVFLSKTSIIRKKLGGGAGEFESIKWSPSGKFLAAYIRHGHASVAVYTRDGKLVKGINERIRYIEWHPVRDELSIIAPVTGSVRHLDCSTMTLSLPYFPWTCGALFAWHPDGDVFVGMRENYLVWVNATTNRQLYTSSPFQKFTLLETLKWDPTGTTLAVVTVSIDFRGRIITLWTATGKCKKKITILASSDNFCCFIQWNFSGSHFVASTLAGVVRVYDSDGNLVKRLDADQPPQAQDVAWHPTKNELLVSENTVLQIWH